MKTFWVAVIIGVLLVGGGVMFNRNIDSVTREMSEKEKKITALLGEKDFAGAERELDELSKYIDEKMIVLASVVDHKNVDDIEMCVAEIKGYTLEQDKSSAIARGKKLEHLIGHLPINYKVTLQNIL